MNYNDKIKQLLDDVIHHIANNKNNYVLNPDVDFTRNRKLPFEMVIKIILSMKGGALNKELYEFFGRDPEAIATSSAFIQQRDKLSTQLFVDLFNMFNASMTNMETFKDYRLLAVDGSCINVADDKNAATYVKPKKVKLDGELARGYNQYHLNAIYDILNKVYVDVLLQPKPIADERQAFIDMLENMQVDKPTLFIADRGYPSWNMYAHFKYKQNADYLIRVRNGENSLVKELPLEEFDIDRSVIITTNQYYYKKPGYIVVQKLKGTQKNRVYKSKRVNKPIHWDFADEELLNFRIVRFKITDDTYETIFTSLPRDKFSVADIKKLYGMRWGIETSFRELKYVIGLTAMHSKKDSFIKQEIYAKLIMYNFCERIIAQAVIEQDNNNKLQYQVNYTMAMKICLDFYRMLVESDNVYRLIAKYVEALRPGRTDTRKRKPAAKMFVWFLYRVPA